MRDKHDAGTLDLETGRLLIGYARVSTDDQDLRNQRDELHAAGCTRIFAEKVTGSHSRRPELARMLDHLRPGDVVMAETGTVSMGLGFALLPEGAEFFNQTLWGAIGWATPASFGAALAALTLG